MSRSEGIFHKQIARTNLNEKKLITPYYIMFGISTSGGFNFGIEGLELSTLVGNLDSDIGAAIAIGAISYNCGRLSGECLSTVFFP